MWRGRATAAKACSVAEGAVLRTDGLRACKMAALFRESRWRSLAMCGVGKPAPAQS